MKGTEGYKIRSGTCIGCGALFTKRMPAGRRYCSLDCYRRSKRPARRTGFTYECVTCGKGVYIPKNRSGQDVYFCSVAHATEWQRRTKVAFSCKVCGKGCFRSPSVERL